MTTKQQVEYANTRNKKLLIEAFKILAELDCDRADCDRCIFFDPRTETKCHLSYPMSKYHLL